MTHSQTEPNASAAGESSGPPGVVPEEAAPLSSSASGGEEGALTGRLSGLSLPRQVIALAIWPLLEQFMNFLVGTVDLALATRLKPDTLGLQATDALGVAGYVGWLMSMIQAAVGVGASALVARAVGGRHKRLSNAALGQALLLAVAFGAIMGGIIFLLAPLIGYVAGLEGHEQTLCVIYLRIIAAISPFSALLFVGGACLRGAGDTRSPFWVMVAVNAVNVAASVAFVYAVSPIGGHGVAGIASGTAVAWIVGSALIVAVLLSGRAPIRLRLHRLRPHPVTAWRIIRVGMPNLLESVGQWGGNFMILMIVGRLSLHGAIGSHMIAIRLESVSFLGGLALGIAAATLAGQYLGANRPDLARRAVILSWAMGAGLMGCVGILFLTMPEYLVRIISAVPLHQKTVPPLLHIAGCIQIFFATYIVLSQAIRGAGDTTAAMLMTYGSTFFVRLPLAYVLGIWLGLGLWGVWLGLCTELTVRGCLFAARFLHGGWQHVRV